MRPYTTHTFILSYDAEIWKDSELKLEDGKLWDITDVTFSVAILLEGAACSMRIAFGQDSENIPYAQVAEWRCALSPGLNLFRFTPLDLVALRDVVDPHCIDHVSFGGQSAFCRVVAHLCLLKP